MKFLTENGMYAAAAEKGMVINYGNGYCHKLYRKENDFSNCTEVDESEIPVLDEITDTEALEILLGGGV